METHSLGKENVPVSIAEGLQNVHVYLQKLNAIWCDFGMEDEQRTQREKVVWKHMNNLLQDIYDEELSFYKDVKERIQYYTQKIEELVKVLSITPEIESSKSLIKKEENLRQQLDNLTKLKHKRVKSYQELRSVESRYCSLLGTKVYQLVMFYGVPSESDLIKIEQHIKTLKEEHEKRRKKFYLAKKELTTILETTELTPETLFEKQILSESNSVPLTSDTLKSMEEVVSKAHKRKTELESQKEILISRLTTLWDRLRVPESKKIDFLSKHMDCKLSTLKAIQNELETCERVKKENTKMFINSLREELKELWNKCYISDSGRELFTLYFSVEVSDEVLEAHEREVEKWKMYYREVEHIHVKIEERNKLWELLLKFESKTTDPNRFRNRKGNLLQEEKERKKLQKDLPALESDIFEEIELYESVFGKPFLYFGEDYRNFITSQWQERIDQKENAKVKRQSRCKSQVENVTPGTPFKRPLSTTPKSVPKKVLKHNSKLSAYHTPTSSNSKALPYSVEKTNPSCGKYVESVQKSVVKCKLFTSGHSKLSNVKNNSKNVTSDKLKGCRNTSILSNSTTYSQFANELDSTLRHNLKSSILSIKMPGTIRKSVNTSIEKQKSISKPLRRSKRNVSRTVTKDTIGRGKLGLPFLI